MNPAFAADITSKFEVHDRDAKPVGSTTTGRARMPLRVFFDFFSLYEEFLELDLACVTSVFVRGNG